MVVAECPSHTLSTNSTFDFKVQLRAWKAAGDMHSCKESQTFSFSCVFILCDTDVQF